MFISHVLFFYAILGKMDKYRLVEEKFIGAQGFIDDSKMTGDARPDSESGAEYVVRITQQAKPRRCITTAMNMLVGICALTLLVN